MKKILTFVLVCLVAVAMCAQENLVVKYKVSSRDTDSGQPRSYDMTLVANSNEVALLQHYEPVCRFMQIDPRGACHIA